MAEYLVQAILHSFVAAWILEALLRLWRIRDPGLKLRFRLLTLAYPVLLLPAVALLAPARREEWFQERWAVFVARRWAELQPLGFSLYTAWLALFGGLGVALFLVDAVPFVREWRRERELAAALPPPPGLLAEVAALARAMGIAAPPVAFLDRAAPFLLCVGALRPTLVVSRGTLERLDASERRAALAHELGHLAGRDPLLSWVLMGARVLQFFNPVAHVLVRAIAREAERRADDTAARVGCDRLAVASGLIKLYRASQGAQGTDEPAWGPFVTRARAAAIEERCRRLLDVRPAQPPVWGRLKLALAGLSVGVLLFFVV